MTSARRIGMLLLLAACGGGARDRSAASAPSGTPADGGQVDERVVVEKLPDGRVKRTTIRTTRKVVPAEAPSARPADPWPTDPLVRYNVERVNAYRAKLGRAPLLYDAAISAFATRGSERLSIDHVPHAHFAANAKGSGAFAGGAAENQGDPNGVPPFDADRVKSGQRQIDVMLDLMFQEGPGGGHYENMIHPRYKRMGVGLVNAGGKLYMTNDFSE